MDFQSEKSFGKLRLRAFQPYHQILCMLKHVEDVEDRSNTPKGCNAMLCMPKMSKMHSIECIEYCTKDQAMSKMSKIDQIHLRAVMLCMSETSKMGKEHTHTFWLITSLILNGFQSEKSFGKLRLRAFQPYHQILCMLKHVEDVKDRSNTPKGCNAMYVEMSKIYQIHLRAVMLCYVCRRCRRCIALNALNTVQKIKVMSKMSKIDQIHLRAVMLCMSKTSKMHTNVYELQCRF